MIAPPRHVIGVDIGGTKCAVSQLVGGRVIETLRVPTTDLTTTLSRLVDGILRLRDQRPLSIGVSCGGPLDTKRGVMLTPPNLDATWHHVALGRLLTDSVGGQVRLMNDANACALAEWKFGAGRGVQHMIFLTSGTGTGAGLILNGDLYEGATGDAGEVGHVRLREVGPIGYGKAGSIEGFCSGGGIARLAELHLGEIATRPAWAKSNERLTARIVAEAARSGDSVAQRVMAEAGDRMGEMLALLVDLFNPERIVLGGFFGACGDLLQPRIDRVLKDEALVGPLAACTILASELGDTIGSYGAIAAALKLSEAETS